MSDKNMSKNGYRLVHNYYKKNLEIPEDWNYVKYKDVLIEKEEPVIFDDNAFYRLITVKRRNEGLILREILKGNQILTKSLFSVKPGDFIISRMQIIHGACGIVPEDLGDAKISGSYVRFSSNEKLILKYFDFFSKTPLFFQHTFISSVGSNLEKMNFNKKHWLEHFFPLPSLKEQQKIVSILSNMEELIIKYDELITKTIKIKNAILNELVIHGISHTNFKNISLGRSFLSEKIPHSWNVKKLKDLATVRGRIGWKNLRSDEYVDFGPMMLSVWSMPDDVPFGIDFTQGIERLTQSRYEESPEIQLQNNDVLLSKDGANIGKVGFVKNLSENATVNSHIAVIRPNEKSILGEYLYWYLKSIYFRKYCQSSITGTGTPGFSQDSIRKSIIPLPELDEQQKISNILIAYENEVFSYSQLRSNLETLKKGLIQKLLTGQILVKV